MPHVLCCISYASFHRKISNYDLTWSRELELDQHIVAMASAGGPIGVCVCMRACVCVCVHACVRACVCVERVSHAMKCD